MKIIVRVQFLAGNCHNEGIKGVKIRLKRASWNEAIKRLATVPEWTAGGKRWNNSGINERNKERRGERGEIPKWLFLETWDRIPIAQRERQAAHNKTMGGSNGAGEHENIKNKFINHRMLMPGALRLTKPLVPSWA